MKIKVANKNPNMSADAQTTFYFYSKFYFNCELKRLCFNWIQLGDEMKTIRDTVSLRIDFDSFLATSHYVWILFSQRTDHMCDNTHSTIRADIFFFYVRCECTRCSDSTELISRANHSLFIAACFKVCAYAIVCVVTSVRVCVCVNHRRRRYLCTDYEMAQTHGRE